MSWRVTIPIVHLGLVSDGLLCPILWNSKQEDCNQALKQQALVSGAGPPSVFIFIHNFYSYLQFIVNVCVIFKRVDFLVFDDGVSHFCI